MIRIEDRQVLEMAMLCESKWWLYTAFQSPGEKKKGSRGPRILLWRFQARWPVQSLVRCLWGHQIPFRIDGLVQCENLIFQFSDLSLRDPGDPARYRSLLQSPES